MSASMQLCWYGSIRVCEYVSMQVCTQVCMYVCRYVSKYVCVYIYIRTHVYMCIYIYSERERGTENHLEPLHELIFTCDGLHTACHMHDQSLHLPCRTHSFQSPAAHNPAVHWIPNRARSGAPPVLHPKFHRSLIDGLCSCQRGQWRVSEHVQPPQRPRPSQPKPHPPDWS